MAKSIISITPVTNIKDGCVVDETKIEIKTCQTYMDVFVFYNVMTQITRRSNLEHVSLYDDLIVEGDIRHKILRMLTK
jgi:hypothetical protein